MPIRKYRSFKEAEDDLWCDPGDPALYRKIRAVWEFSRKTAPIRFPPGVHKYRTMEEANRDREEKERLSHQARIAGRE